MTVTAIVRGTILLHVAEHLDAYTDEGAQQIVAAAAHPAHSMQSAHAAFLDLVEAVRARDNRNDDWSAYSDTYLDPESVWAIKTEAVEETLRVLVDAPGLAVAS